MSHPVEHALSLLQAGGQVSIGYGRCLILLSMPHCLESDTFGPDFVRRSIHWLCRRYAPDERLQTCASFWTMWHASAGWMPPTSSTQNPSLVRRKAEIQQVSDCHKNAPPPHTARSGRRTSRHFRRAHRRSVDENKEAPPPWQRPGTGKRQRNRQIISTQDEKRRTSSLYPS